MREVKVVPYDEKWPKMFNLEAEGLRRLLTNEIIGVNHIGSTSIPDMPAKPIIDVLVEVKNIQRIDQFTERLAVNGYKAFGEYGIPGRRFFIKGTLSNRTHHIHMFQTGDKEISRHLAFRDFLIANHHEALQYGALKKKLAKENPVNIEKYIQGKHDFIQKIDRMAAEWN
ncbi:GrpB family protein [Rummeliibacillus pycnus]|uniref:GrpB family protein n=1 Tax=Rummeliibacillus pycnus TaxID=101070 RepID=UPI003D27817F